VHLCIRSLESSLVLSSASFQNNEFMVFYILPKQYARNGFRTALLNTAFSLVIELKDFWVCHLRPFLQAPASISLPGLQEIDVHL
jgi:hypothetical protein